jgi:hypothetical protein
MRRKLKNVLNNNFPALVKLLLVVVNKIIISTFENPEI